MNDGIAFNPGNAVMSGQGKKTWSSFKKEELLPYLKVARGMEAEFVKYMLDEMRKTVAKDEADSGEIDFYTSMLDNEYSRIMSEKERGLGVQGLVLNQIAPQRLLKEYNGTVTGFNEDPLARGIIRAAPTRTKDEAIHMYLDNKKDEGKK
jgi:Rod binding domain-containing protein